MADFRGRKRGKSHVQNMGIFFGGSGHVPESSCKISAYYKFFPGLHVFCRISTGLLLRISGYAPRAHKGYVLFVCCRPAPNSGQKIGLSLSEDLFFHFFPLHLILGKKSDNFLV